MSTLAFFLTQAAQHARKYRIYQRGMRRVFYYLLSTHPDWKRAPRRQIKTAIRTCSASRETCSKNEISDLGHKMTQNDTLGHIDTGALRGAPGTPRS